MHEDYQIPLSFSIQDFDWCCLLIPMLYTNKSEVEETGHPASWIAE